MRPLAWLLIRWPNTISIENLVGALEVELDLRALAAANGHRSANQLNPLPPNFWAWVIAALAVLLFVTVRTHINLSIHR